MTKFGIKTKYPMIRCYETISGKHKRGTKWGLIPVAGIIIVGFFFPKYEVLLSIPLILVLAVTMIPYLHSATEVICPSCGGVCHPANKMGPMAVKCSTCGEVHETDCVFDYAGAKPRRREGT